MRKLLVVAVWMGVACACKEHSERQPTYTTNSPRVNLFPQEIAGDLQQEMSLDQAIARSDKVVRSNQITLVDVSAKERSTKVFYLYKVDSSKTIKEDIQQSTETPVDSISPFYFYSDQLLHFNLQEKDSMYLFLQANHDKKILTAKYKIAYKWLDNCVSIPK